jgi:hypothetical protein
MLIKTLKSSLFRFRTDHASFEFADISEARRRWQWHSAPPSSAEKFMTCGLIWDRNWTK